METKEKLAAAAERTARKQAGTNQPATKKNVE
jgi:hypothetical protein